MVLELELTSFLSLFTKAVSQIGVQKSSGNSHSQEQHNLIILWLKVT